jgi:hypothetical protein
MEMLCAELGTKLMRLDHRLVWQAAWAEQQGEEKILLLTPMIPG